jgi:RpiB/LacA/LacB family sugar-phosphate isomerase
MDRIIIGSDHAGFQLKEAEPSDYPDFGVIVAEKVSSGEFERGILVCGSGVGMTIVANKFPGIRAILCLDEETARLSRLHNNTNILVLAGRRTDKVMAETIIGIWLKTAFEGGRHQRRLDKISGMETKLYK